MIESIISNKQFQTLLAIKNGQSIEKVSFATINALFKKRAIDECNSITELGDMLLQAHVKAVDLAEEEFKKLESMRDEVEKLRKEAAEFYNVRVRAKIAHIEELKQEIQDIRSSLLNDRELMLQRVDKYRALADLYNDSLPRTHYGHSIDVNFNVDRFTRAANYIKNGPHRSDFEEIGGEIYVG